MKNKFAQIVTLLVVGVLLGAQIGQATRPENFQLRGTLTFDESQVPSADYEVGNFIVKWRTENGGQLTIEAKDRPDFAVWQTVPGEAFVMAAQNDMQVEENRGIFKFDDNWRDVCTTLRMLYISDIMPHLTIGGELVCASGKIIDFDLVIVDYDSNNIATIYAHIDLPPKDPAKIYNQIFLTYATTPEERFFGFGEQFTHFDMKEKKVPIWVSEQGVGRGEEPITTGANITNGGAGGNDLLSYAPMPVYVTSQLRSVFFLKTLQHPPLMHHLI